jgi:hypothetical protein
MCRLPFLSHCLEPAPATLVQRVDPQDQPLAMALAAVTAGRPTAVAQAVDGPEGVLGRTLCLFGDGPAYDGPLGGARENQAVAAQPERTSQPAVPASSDPLLAQKQVEQPTTCQEVQIRGPSG